MKRKVIKQGHNTLTITLPCKWAKKQGINAGDEIDFEEKDNALLLSTDKQAPLLKITLDTTGVSIPVLWRHLISAYRAGYDEIIIRFDPPEEKNKEVYTGFGYQTLQWLFPKGILKLTPIEAIQALVNRLVGVEIIDQKENYCVIKEMGETMFKEFDNSLRRIFLLILSMANEIYASYTTNKKEMLKAIHLIDTNLDRFEDFCLRVLNKKSYSDYKKTTTMYNLVFILEMVGDEYKKIALHLLSMKGKPNPLLAEELEMVNEQTRRFYTFFYTFSKKTACEIYAADEEGEQFLEKNYASFSDKEKEIIHHLKKIESYILSLTELRIDLAV
jgi:phosphate uptake regulator